MTTFLTLSLLLGAFARADDKIRDSAYFPLSQGTQWEYRSGDQKLIVRVASHQRVGDLQVALLETRSDRGTLVGSEHIAVKEDGVYRFTHNGNKLEPPVCLLKLPPKKGETWKVEARISGETVKGTFRAGEDELTVAAVRYKTVTVASDDCTVNEAPFRFTSWYARSIGMVKQVIKINGNEVVLELEKFTLAP